MKLEKFLQLMLNPSKKMKRFAALLIIFSLLFNTLLVYITGGIPSAFAHTMYLSALLAAVFYGPLIASITGIIGGILVGPVMSIDIMPGDGELLINSIYRTAYFVFMGLSVGLLLNFLKFQLKKLHDLNTHDALTGIPNINYYIEKRSTNTLTKQVGLTLQVNNHEALILLIGNHAYSLVLKQLYESIHSFLPNEAIMVYVDERRFWIEIPFEDYEHIIESLMQHLESVNLTDGNIPLFFDYSLGISALGNPTNSMQRFHESDVASMYAKNRAFKLMEYNPSFEQDQDGFKLIGKLPQAIQDDELFLLYQPIIDLRQNVCNDCEALIRWRHHGEVIQPKDFIILSEKTRIINQITYWVTNRIVRDYPTFQEHDHNIHVSMNFSQRNLYERELIDYIIKKIRKAELPSNAIEIEITESTLMLNQQEAYAFLELFKAEGIPIILDDFGNEYSSLAFLRDLPVGKIKIDRNFTMNIVSNPNTRLLVDTIIDLAHGMGFKVVAEGIENEDILKVLLEMGCDYGQGFYYAKPMTKEDLVVWLDERRKIS